MKFTDEELESIRQYLRRDVESSGGEVDGISREWLSRGGLPDSVVDWVLG